MMKSKFGIAVLLMCFSLGSLSSNRSLAGFTAYQQAQFDVYLYLGFPSTTVYNTLTSGLTGVPQGGILGRMQYITTSIISQMKSGGVTSCAAIPSTGSFTGTTSGNGITVNWTAKYATPTHTIPTGYTNAGTAFTKRINVTFADIDGSGNSDKIGLEFLCGADESYLEFQADNQMLTGSFRSGTLYMDNTDVTNVKAEIMGKVSSSNTTGGVITDAQIARININQAAKTFTLNNVLVHTSNGKVVGYRAGIVGNADGTASVYLTTDLLGVGTVSTPVGLSTINLNGAVVGTYTLAGAVSTALTNAGASAAVAAAGLTAALDPNGTNTSVQNAVIAAGGSKPNGALAASVFNNGTGSTTLLVTGTTNTIAQTVSAAQSAALTAMTDSDFSTQTATNYQFSCTGAPSASGGTCPTSPSGGLFFPAQILQGCLNFATQTDPTSTALCSGNTLTAPTAPLADSSGSFSYSWLQSKIDSVVTMGF